MARAASCRFCSNSRWALLAGKYLIVSCFYSPNFQAIDHTGPSVKHDTCFLKFTQIWDSYDREELPQTS